MSASRSYGTAPPGGCGVSFHFLSASKPLLAKKEHVTLSPTFGFAGSHANVLASIDRRQRVGAAVGLVDGLALGETDGLTEGDVLGDTDGETLGLVLGDADGETLGLVLGETDGDTVGLLDGLTLGLADGAPEGLVVGERDGDTLGEVLGAALGLVDGIDVGDALGEIESGESIRRPLEGSSSTSSKPSMPTSTKA